MRPQMGEHCVKDTKEEVSLHVAGMGKGPVITTRSLIGRVEHYGKVRSRNVIDFQLRSKFC